MKRIKQIIGIILLVNIFPVIVGLSTLDGKLCLYGDCNNVLPFWGGFIAVYCVYLLSISIWSFIIFVCKTFFN